MGRACCWWKEGFDESLPDLHVGLYKENLEANGYEASAWSPTKFRRALVREAHPGGSTGLEGAHSRKVGGGTFFRGGISGSRIW